MTPEIGPHGYLVLRHYLTDDLPIRFFWDRDDAIEYCDDLTIDNTEGLMAMLDVNHTDEIAITVLHFANGKPVGVIYYRSLV